MMSCPISADKVVADLDLCTYEYLDHMDVDALPVIAKSSRTHFSGPKEVALLAQAVRPKAGDCSHF